MGFEFLSLGSFWSPFSFVLSFFGVEAPQDRRATEAVGAFLSYLGESFGAALTIGLVGLGVLLFGVAIVWGFIKDLKARTAQGYGGVTWCVVLAFLCFLGSVGVFVLRSAAAVFFNDGSGSW